MVYPTRIIRKLGTILAPVDVSSYKVPQLGTNLTNVSIKNNQYWGMNGWYNQLNPTRFVQGTYQTEMCQAAIVGFSTAGIYYCDARLSNPFAYRAITLGWNGSPSGQNCTMFGPSLFGQGYSFFHSPTNYYVFSWVSLPLVILANQTITPKSFAIAGGFSGTLAANYDFQTYSPYFIYDFGIRNLRPIIGAPASIVNPGAPYNNMAMQLNAGTPTPIYGVDEFGRSVNYYATAAYSAVDNLAGAPWVVDPINGNFIFRATAYFNPTGYLLGSVYNFTGAAGAPTSYQYIKLSDDNDQAELNVTNSSEIVAPGGGFVICGYAAGATTGNYFFILRDFSGYFKIAFQPQSSTAATILHDTFVCDTGVVPWGFDLNGNFWKMSSYNTGTNVIGSLNLNRTLLVNEFPPINPSGIHCRIVDGHTFIWEG